MAVEKARARWTVPIRNLLFVCSLCVYGTLDGKLRTLFDIVDTARCGALSSTQVRVVRGGCSCPKLLPCECVRLNAARACACEHRRRTGNADVDMPCGCVSEPVAVPVFVFSARW